MMKKESTNLNSVENMKSYNLNNKKKVCIDINEEPNLSSDVYDKGIPKTFTLVAEKNVNI